MITIAEYLDRIAYKKTLKMHLTPGVIFRADEIFQRSAEAFAHESICEAINEFVDEHKQWHQSRIGSQRLRFCTLQWCYMRSGAELPSQAPFFK